VGLASGEIYRCSDLPCTASNGAFYSLAPTPGRVLAIADDGVLMYWTADGQGIFKEDAVTPVRLVAGPLVTLDSTSLALDASYVYFPDDHTLRATRIDGSTVNTPLALATSPAVIASVVSTPEHVFFTAPPSYVAATCKRFLNGACN
jgi:hypothetical protein